MEYEYLTEEQIQEIINEYGDISYYIKDKVQEYKKDTTDFMDRIKFIVFAYLLLKKPIKDFKEKLNREFEEYGKGITNKTNKTYLAIADLTKFKNKGISITKEEKLLKSGLNKVLERIKLDGTSTKSANDRYIKVLTNYYNSSIKVVNKEIIPIDKYLSNKVKKFDKVEKTIAYHNKNGSIRGYYDIASYDSMVYNSNLSRKGWQETIKDAQRRSYDVVYVEPHIFSCPLCQEWQGKFYSLTGATKEYPNIQVAFDGGLLHPNCTHQIREKYINDKETSIYSGAEWEEKYQTRQKLNGLNLQKSRIKNDNKIYEKLGDYEAIDKNKQKIKALNSQIRELKNTL